MITSLNIHYLDKKYCTGIFTKQEKFSLKIKDLKFQNGTYGIIGKNGSGKSTMAKALAEIIMSNKKITSKKKFLYFNSKKDIFNADISMEDNLKIIFTIDELCEIKKNFNFEFNLKKFIFKIVEQGSKFYNFVIDEDFVNSFLKTNEFIKLIKKKEKENIFFIISHNIDIIEKFCKYSLIIKGGNILFFGETKTAINYYYEDVPLKIKKNFNNFSIFNISSFKKNKSNKLTVISNNKNNKNINNLIVELYSNSLILFSEKFTLKKKLTLYINKKILGYGRYNINITLLDKNITTNTFSVQNRKICFTNKNTIRRNGVFWDLIYQT